MEWIPVRFYGPVRDVIHGWPLEVKKELGSILTRLQKGESIGMPDVRPMPDLGPQVSEIRISGRSGSYRALYAIRKEFGILLFHAFNKSPKTPEREKKTARIRLAAFLKDLEGAR
ncbi:MAG: type II toxin-antitoxin system RelE/ParE family toxin [Acidobacteria bacterium]|nr:type II toxin-antitoxin system RelE/ParE family toxin [Acidobacteriota bacterium]